MCDNDEESEWYGCPRCKRIWGDEYRVELEEWEEWDGPEVLFDVRGTPNTPNAEVLSAVEGEEFKIKEFPFGMHYPKKLCPICRPNKEKLPEELLLDERSTDLMALERIPKLMNSKSTPITEEDVNRVMKEKLADLMKLDDIYKKSLCTETTSIKKEDLEKK